jgi:diacylglycerol kinase family enzyme
VFIFSDMSKLDLISYAMQSTGGAVEDARIMHYRVKQLTIHSDPQMPVLADGVLLAQGTVSALVHPHALAVIVGVAGAAMGGQSIGSSAIDREVVSNG